MLPLPALSPGVASQRCCPFLQRVGGLASARALVCGTFVTRPCGILAALPLFWDESEELRSVPGAGRGSVSLLSHGQSSVGSLGLCFASSCCIKDFLPI